MKKFIFAVLAAIVLGACSHGSTIEAGQKTAVGQPGVITVWADWVKDKGKKFDMDFHIKNESSKYIIVMLEDMSCKRGNDVGRLKYTFFNTGERTIDFGPGQHKGAHMVCSFGTHAEGAYEIDIERVFDNPSTDRRTPGKVIATNIVWKVTPKDEK